MHKDTFCVCAGVLDHGSTFSGRPPPMIGIPTQSGLVLGSLFTTKSQVLIRLGARSKELKPDETMTSKALV